MMRPERWARIEVLCQEALELPDAERAGYLRANCEDDPDLMNEVTSLLGQLEVDPEFLEHPLGEGEHGREMLTTIRDALAAIAADEETLPERIGRYRIVRRLGRGGMGEVFLADPIDNQGGSQVAIKVLRAGHGSTDLIRRFELERRILANLEHPNIARLLDAITTEDGRPAFVLEYIDGRPITDHADIERLTIRERLTLMLSVCSAVEHAHRNLVVHRDIKPGNILVTSAGEAHLLDFGIVKMLGNSIDGGDEFDTATADRMLTLEYAAPEQLLGGVITTATDVHALGILLYELLSGRHPFRSDGNLPGEVERAILQADPLRPSAVVVPSGTSGPVAASESAARAITRGIASADVLRRRLRGDLDNIVLMALRKEPERRYPSVTALADDIRRHLDGLPIHARPDTLGYRARKFIRRNAGSVAVASLTALALIATTAVALLQSHRAAQAVVATTRERDEAQAVRGFLLEMFGSTGSEHQVGAGETVRQMLDIQAGRVEREYRDRPLMQARLLESLASAYERLGLYTESIPLARHALDVRNSSSDSRTADLAASENLLGWVLLQGGKRDEAEPHLERSVALWSRVARAREHRGGMARSLNDLGVWASAAGEYVRAESLLTRSLDLRQQGGDSLRMSVGTTANNLAAAYYYQGKFPEATQTQQIAVSALESAVGPDHQRTIIARSNLAAFRMADGEFADAVTDYRDLLSRQTRLQGRDHPVTVIVMTALSSALTGVAATDDSASTMALAESEQLLQEALAIVQQRPQSSEHQRGAILDRLAGVLLARGRPEEALTLGREAVATLAKSDGPEHQVVAAAKVRLALIEATNGDSAAAIRLGDAGVTGLREKLGDDHPETARGLGRYCRALLLIASASDGTRRVCDEAIAKLGAAPAGYRGELKLVERAVARRES